MKAHKTLSCNSPGSRLQVLQEIPFHPQSCLSSFLAARWPFPSAPTISTALLPPPTLVFLFYYVVRLSRARATMVEWMGDPRGMQNKSKWQSLWAHPSPHFFIPSFVQHGIIEHPSLKALEIQWRKHFSWEKKETAVGSCWGFIPLSYFRIWCIQRANRIFILNLWDK